MGTTAYTAATLPWQLISNQNSKQNKVIIICKTIIFLKACSVKNINESFDSVNYYIYYQLHFE